MWIVNARMHARTHAHTHTQPLYGLLGFCPGLHGWAGNRKVKPIWIYWSNGYWVVSSSGISWAICKSAPWLRHITMPAPHHSVFYRPDVLPAAQPTASKHWRQWIVNAQCNNFNYQYEISTSMEQAHWFINNGKRYQYHRSLTCILVNMYLKCWILL